MHLEHDDFLFLRFFATADSDLTGVDADADADEQDVCSNDEDDADGDPMIIHNNRLAQCYADVKYALRCGCCA